MIKKTKLEDAIKRLEEIVSLLENGNDDLEKIVGLFEEGSDLVKVCRQRLEDFENKIEIISGSINSKDNDNEV